MASTTAQPPPPPIDRVSEVDFREAAVRALNGLCAACRKLVQVSPIPIAKAADLHRVLDVQASLGWQLFRLGTATDPFEANAFVPGAGLIAKAAEAARTRGFGEEVAKELADAFAAYERLVEEHAGDRGAFDVMVNSLRQGESEDAAADAGELRERRTHFRSSARLWGLQCKALYSCTIFYQNPASAHCLMAGITGRVDLRQLRSQPPIVYSSRRSILGTELYEQEDGRAVLQETNVESSSTPIMLEEFCRGCSPKILSTITANNYVEDVITLDGVGRASSVDYFKYSTTTLAHNYRTNDTWGQRVLTHVPCELLFLDLLVPRGWSRVDTPIVSTHGNLHDIERAAWDPEKYVMPSRDRALYLGTDLDELRDAAIPKCPSIVRRTLRKLNWDETEFDIFRCRVRYPLLHTVTRVMVWAQKDAK